MLPESYEAQLTRFRAEKKRMNALFRFLEKKSKKELDSLFYPLYQEIFFRYDCTECAHCCSVLGPRFADKDVERLAAYFRMKKKQFASAYLETDEDGDLVLNELPCPFLCDDNRCLVYNDRPKACRDFPHLLDGMTKEVLRKTELNGSVCPPTAEILLLLADRFQIKA